MIEDAGHESAHPRGTRWQTGTPSSKVIGPEEAFPASIDTERLVLGSVLKDYAAFGGVLASLSIDHFCIEKHRRIYRRMMDLHTRGEWVDRVTVFNELLRHSENESVGGLSYIVSLDDGLPQLPNIDSYLRILHEIAALRRIVFGCHHLANRARSGDTSTEIVAAAEDLFSRVTTGTTKLSRVVDLPSVHDCGTTNISYIREPELPCGVVVALTGDSGSGKSTLITAGRETLRFQFCSSTVRIRSA